MQKWIRNLAGRFIVFDGPDGSGKTTQFTRFGARCREAGLGVCEVREPGGTSIGEQIRAVLLDPDNFEMSLPCEMMLYMASRAQLVQELIRPALEAGQVVLADRFISSTLAYQGSAGGMCHEDILAVGRVALEGIWRDLTVIFDVDQSVAAARLNPLLDRMEQKGVEFHQRVRRAFLAQAEAHPEGYLVIDATREVDAVSRALVDGIAERVRARRQEHTT